jgi:hypothetical protein
MAQKGFFEAFREGWTEGSKRKMTSARLIKTAKSVQALKPTTPEQPYQWIREAKYRGQDTSLEPKPYRGLWKWLKNWFK